MGQGYSFECSKCDYTLEFIQGIGFSYLLEADKMLTSMQQGRFGKRFMEAANKATAPSVAFSRELYRCEECGELSPDLQMDLLDGGEVILSKKHVCGKCRSSMKLVKSMRTLKCPKCKAKLVEGDVIFWD